MKLIKLASALGLAFALSACGSADMVTRDAPFSMRTEPRTVKLHRHTAFGSSRERAAAASRRDHAKDQRGADQCARPRQPDRGGGQLVLSGQRYRVGRRPDR